MNECQVCGSDDNLVVVACSSVAAMSLRYCSDCLLAKREPYGLLVAACYGVSCYDELSESYKPIVEATLTFFGKTREHFFADVAAFGQAYGAAYLHV